MRADWQVRLSIGDQEVQRVTTARARSLAARALAVWDGELKGWANGSPTLLELVLGLPTEPPPDVQGIAEAIRGALGLLPGESLIHELAETEADAASDPQGIRALRGSRPICNRCAGVDGHHAKGCPAGPRPTPGSAA